jgi:hypothetical protein
MNVCLRQCQVKPSILDSLTAPSKAFLMSVIGCFLYLSDRRTRPSSGLFLWRPLNTPRQVSLMVTSRERSFLGCGTMMTATATSSGSLAKPTSAIFGQSKNEVSYRLYGDPGKIRTSDLRFRKPSLYPPELRGHVLITCLSLNAVARQPCSGRRRHNQPTGKGVTIAMPAVIHSVRAFSIHMGSVALCRNDSDCGFISIPYCLETNFIPLSPARLIYKRGAKAGDACAAFVPHTGIKDSVRLLGEQLPRQQLRREVALRHGFGLKTILIFFHRLQSVKGRVKVSLPIVVGGDVLVWPFLGQSGNDDFCKPLRFVVSNFRNRSIYLFGRVPSAARRVVEARARWAGMKKRSANDMSVGNSVYQFERADSAQPVEFALHTLVGRGI